MFCRRRRRRPGGQGGTRRVCSCILHGQSPGCKGRAGAKLEVTPSKADIVISLPSGPPAPHGNASSTHQSLALGGRLDGPRDPPPGPAGGPQIPSGEPTGGSPRLRLGGREAGTSLGAWVPWPRSWSQLRPRCLRAARRTSLRGASGLRP